MAAPWSARTTARGSRQRNPRRALCSGVRRDRASTAIGLCLALGGPPAVALACQDLRTPPVVTLLVGQAGLIALAAAVLYPGRPRQDVPWAALGVRVPGPGTILGALALAAVYMWIASPLAYGLLRLAGTSDFSAGLARLAVIPVWARAIAVLVAGVVEELLYRGYAIERLTWLTGRRWLAGALATLLFSAAHVPLWGVPASASLLIAGTIGTAVYLWRRDLVLNLIAHVITDAAGLLLLARSAS